jgi:NAD(P)-dependent dehydrogenase (short-subunit alcohol dehydrogenase family)
VHRTGRIDMLINNAAYQMSQEGGISDITTEQLDRVMKTNVYAMFWLSKFSLPHLSAGSTIINTASGQGFQPSPHLLDYATSKAAIVNFTRDLGQQLAERGIRVNAVAPGPVWTPLSPPRWARTRSTRSAPRPRWAPCPGLWPGFVRPGAVVC